MTDVTRIVVCYLGNCRAHVWPALSVCGSPVLEEVEMQMSDGLFIDLGLNSRVSPIDRAIAVLDICAIDLGGGETSRASYGNL